MHKRFASLVFTAAAFLGAAVLAQQTAPTPTAPSHPTGRRPTTTPSSFQAVATVQDLMAGMIDPASKIVFTAVSSEVTVNGTVEKAPTNDSEWAVVRRSALMMVEGANLLLIPGRHITRTSADRRATPETSAVEGELPPSEIEIRVAKDRSTFNKLAVQFREAALMSLKAAEGRKTQDFAPAGEAIDNACETCHLRFWYPDQDKLFQKPPR